MSSTGSEKKLMVGFHSTHHAACRCIHAHCLSCLPSSPSLKFVLSVLSDFCLPDERLQGPKSFPKGDLTVCAPVSNRRHRQYNEFLSAEGRPLPGENEWVTMYSNVSQRVDSSVRRGRNSLCLESKQRVVRP